MTGRTGNDLAISDNHCYAQNGHGDRPDKGIVLTLSRDQALHAEVALEQERDRIETELAAMKVMQANPLEENRTRFAEPVRTLETHLAHLRGAIHHFQGIS